MKYLLPASSIFRYNNKRCGFTPLKKIMRLWVKQLIFYYFSDGIYSMISSMPIPKYQHNLHINTASILWNSFRQYLLKFERGMSRSLQTWFLLIPRAFNSSFILRFNFPYSIIISNLNPADDVTSLIFRVL